MEKKSMPFKLIYKIIQLLKMHNVTFNLSVYIFTISIVFLIVCEWIINKALQYFFLILKLRFLFYDNTIQNINILCNIIFLNKHWNGLHGFRNDFVHIK